MFSAVCLISASVYLLFSVAIMKTKNMRSAIVFKFIPLLIAVLCMVAAVTSMGEIV